MEEVAGSIPASSTQALAEVVHGVGSFLGGLVAGEGCFTSTAITPYADGTERRRFVFAVALADRDLPALQALQSFLGGVGSLRRRAPRRSGWQATATFAVSSNRMHLRTTIPFADRYLLPSAKLEQYRAWRAELLSHLAAHPTRYGQGPAACGIDGCERPVRARGLCRAHYYAATGW